MMTNPIFGLTVYLTVIVLAVAFVGLMIWWDYLENKKPDENEEDK